VQDVSVVVAVDEVVAVARGMKKILNTFPAPMMQQQ
jgi:hypothetical protein